MDPDSAQQPVNQQSPQTNPVPTAQANLASTPEVPVDTKSSPIPEPIIQPQTVSTQDIVSVIPGKEPSKTSKSRKKKLIFLTILIFIFITLLSALGIAYAIAYEKIKLTKFPEFQKSVSYFVQSLPFMPKTPKFLLEKSILAHQAVSKLSFDISAAVDSGGLLDSMGVSIYDIELKGAVDFSDPKDVIGSVNAFVTKDFNFELRKKDPVLYFKINKFPTTFLSLVGLGSDNIQPLLNQWVAYDTTPLSTGARQQIDKGEQKRIISSAIEEISEKYLDEEVAKKIVVTSTQESGNNLYKISLNADDALIDYLGEKIEEETATRKSPSKLSDSLKNLVFEIYIDKKSYYTRKIILSLDFKFDHPLLGEYSGLANSVLPSTSMSKFAFAANFNNFGENVVVEIPTSSMTIEEFGQKLFELSSESDSSLSPVNRMKQARDAARKSDLTTLRAAVEIYYTECQEYPPTLSADTSTQSCSGSMSDIIKQIPKDPLETDYYYRTDGQTYDLCAKLEIEPATSSACPNPTYNYHLNSN